MRPKEYPALVEAVAAGVRLGYRRARKHVDDPTEEQVVDAVEQAVLSEICERFEFDEPREG